MKLADASIPWTALGGDCNNVLHLFGLWIRVYFLFLPICTYFAYFACFAYWKGVSVHKGSRSPENATKLYMYKDFKWSLVLQLRSTGQTHTNSIQDERNSVHSFTLTLRKGPGVLSSKQWERGWGVKSPILTEGWEEHPPPPPPTSLSGYKFISDTSFF